MKQEPNVTMVKNSFVGENIKKEFSTSLASLNVLNVKEDFIVWDMITFILVQVERIQMVQAPPRLNTAFRARLDTTVQGIRYNKSYL